MRDDARESVRTWMAETLAGRPGWGRETWRAAATPASWLYAAAAAAARAQRRRGAEQLPGASVVSIGGLTLGGVGKTPCTAWLAVTCRSWGMSPSVISRGYRAPLGRSEVRRARAGEGAMCGDEAAELAQRLGQLIPVYVARDRWRASEQARQAGADIVLLDDAFHVYRPLPQFRIVLLDARHPWGSGHVVPAGDLRESPRALQEADAILLTRAQGTDTRQVRQALGALAPAAAVAEADHVATAVVTLDGREDDRPSGPWWLFTGIARPDDAARAARALGLTLAGHTALADHAVFSASVMHEVELFAAAHGARVLTTEKDAARLPPVMRARVQAQWRALRIDFRSGTGMDLVLARMRASVQPRGL